MYTHIHIIIYIYIHIYVRIYMQVGIYIHEFAYTLYVKKNKGDWETLVPGGYVSVMMQRK